jgi:hypothetical protein
MSPCSLASSVRADGTLSDYNNQKESSLHRRAVVEIRLPFLSFLHPVFARFLRGVGNAGRCLILGV